MWEFLTIVYLLHIWFLWQFAYFKKNIESQTLHISLVIQEIKMWSPCIHCAYVCVYKHIHIYVYSCITTKTEAFCSHSDFTYWHGFVSRYDDQINIIHMTTQDCIVMYLYNKHYRKNSSISRTKSQNLNVSRLLLQRPLPNPLKPDVKLRMKM